MKIRNDLCRLKQSTKRSVGSVSWLAAGGLATALAFGVSTSIYAQETATTQQDTARNAAIRDSTSDSTKWGYTAEHNPNQQNPPGYRGMERPAQLSDSAGVSDSSATADATSRVKQMQRQDSMDSAGQNPPGYRGMEQPVGAVSAKAQQKDSSAAKPAAKKSGAGNKHAAPKNQSRKQAGSETTSQDSTKWGYQVDRQAQVQNPTGYRGMERPVNVFPPDSAQRDSATPADATSRVSQLEHQDSMPNREQQNPPGYRGMERPSGLDSAQDRERTRETPTRSTQDTAEVNRSTEEGSASAGESPRDSVDIIHRRRQVAPGVGNRPPPYPADSERVWVEERPSGDSVNIDAE